MVERAGRVQLLLNGHKQSKAFLDMSGSVNDSGGEQGLLGLAFPRDYGKTGLFYVDYTTSNNDIRVAQFKRSAGDPNAADAGSGRTVLTIDHHAFTNHNGGQLAFGPDGFLYIGVGDGGSEGDPNNHGQSTNTLLAKILRIAPSRGRRLHDSARRTRSSESQATGARSGRTGCATRGASRSTAATGDLIIGDVGQDKYEEIDFQRAGQGRRRELRLERLGGAQPLQGRQRRRTRASRRSSRPTRPATARSSAASWCATVRSAASTAATCSVTTAARRSRRRA